MTTVVFHHGALGDGVLIWPMLRGLWGLGDVALVAPVGAARLAALWIEGLEPLDADRPDHTRMFVPRASSECSDAWRARLAEAARVVSFVSNGRDAWAQNARQMSGDATLAFIRPRPNADDPPVHVTEFHHQQLLEAGIDATPLDPPPRRNHDGPVVIHPGSGGRSKCWPVERYLAVIEHLGKIGRPTTALLGEVELETWPDATVRRLAAASEVRTPGDRVELSRLISGAAVYVGNDAGPTHLAAQLGVPTIALFGPTDPRVWSPVGPLVRPIAPPAPAPMTWLDVEPVVEAIAGWR